MFLRAADAWVVHGGLHPGGDLSDTTRKMAINMRFWPYGAGPEAPHWWQVYTGAGRVVFGHDALRGLVVRRRVNGSPWLMGLDSGCVYGGALTGYLVEEDAVVTVAAGAVYCPVR